MSKKIGVLKMVLIVLLIFLVAASASFARGSRQNTFTIYTWAEMFPQEILDEFERESGFRINYINFDYGEVMLNRLQASNGSGYDLIIVDDYILERVIQLGLTQRLDRSQLSNYGNINPIYLNQFYDPQNLYTVPYGAGVQTIVYDPSRVSIPITGYADLWHPSLRNQVGIIGNYRVINGMALKVLGRSYNTNNLEEIRAAGDLLLELAPNIRLIKDDRLEADLLSGEISVAVMYTSQVTNAMLENPNLRVVFPTEGIGFGIMAGFIPSGAAHPEVAHQFMNFLMDPRRGAAAFEYLGYYSTYSGSDPYISPIFRPFLTLPQGFNYDMEMIQNVNEASDEEHSRIWTRFRAATGN
ncbi:MAG: spermidine/putrescine ABC transporter substrate-binding protein [Treponema sp.]|nr:spermidine/putrescine ABC transporter substrate-binding protein [Treponema sp.]